jgi:hypothetical protein
MPTDVEILTDEAKRLNKALGPVMAGFIIDVVDFATFGPIGLVLGLPGAWPCSKVGMRRSRENAMGVKGISPGLGGAAWSCCRLSCELCRLSAWLSLLTNSTQKISKYK